MENSQPIDVDAILAVLDRLHPELLAIGDDPWGGANMAQCGNENCRCMPKEDGASGGELALKAGPS